MSTSHIILSSWLFVCEKLSNLAEIWQNSYKNKLGHFLAHPVEVIMSTTQQNVEQ